jgi:hypothetical protein
VIPSNSKPNDQPTEVSRSGSGTAIYLLSSDKNCFIP